MENEILSLLKNINDRLIRVEEGQNITNERLVNLEEGQKKLEEGQKKLEEGQKKLEEGQQRIEKKIDITYDQVARTAEDVTELKKDLLFVEEATSKNWHDIARLKAIK